MTIPQQPRRDRFESYNAQQKKNPPVTTDYPRMLTNEDGSTSIVQDADEHQELVGVTKFETAPFWGPSLHSAPRVEPEKAPEVSVTDEMRKRKGSKAQNLGNTGATVQDLVPPQTVFTDVPPAA